MKKSLFIFTLLMITVLALSACSPKGETTEAAASTESVATQPAAAGSCLVGSWSLTDFSAYMNSIEQNTSKNSGATVTITSQAFTGKANFTFNSDGTAKFSADNFNQKFTLSTDVSGQKLDIPITLNINGSSTAKYSVADNKITFSDQNQGDQKITVDTMGSASSIDGLLGKSGTMQLYQYTCTDANTLSLKVIAVKNVDLAPLTLTREK